MGGTGGSSNHSWNPPRLTPEEEKILKAREEATIKTVGLCVAQIMLGYDRNQRAEIIREAQRLLGCKDNIF